jgi:methanethiol S-methyltransferase
MNENIMDHFNNWGAVVIWIVLYGLLIFFLPFYKKCGTKPKGTYIAFIAAFALEMFGLPFSIYVISWIFGFTMPEGVFWGHTFFDTIGYWGMYIGGLFMIGGITLILIGWRRIYREYWSRKKGDGKIVETGIYRYIRHPQYTGLFMITLGMLLEWMTIPLLIMWPVILFTYIRLAKKEEREMTAEFGREYIEYKSRTGMFLPKLRKQAKTHSIPTST